MTGRYDVVIVGGGIVGLATALALTDRWPGARVAIVEKEPSWGRHQTSHNSGVIHAGVYYAPGSLKARLSVRGNQSMKAFCEAEGVEFAVPGKLVVATTPEESARLEELERRTIANGVEAHRLRPEEVAEREPHVRALSAIHVPSTGIVDFGDVCAAMVRRLGGRGVTLLPGHEVVGLETTAEAKIVRTGAGELVSGFVVSCAGLHSDRVARLDGAEVPARILPFRGEYYELVPERRSLVNGLVYPVPNPAFPFLGVHFTRGIHGDVHAGPNAVPALKREGYRRRDVSARDVAEFFGYSGTWRLARRYAKEASKEIARSSSKALFTRSLQRLVPEVRRSDLVPAASGVRAQAVGADGRLVDDFLVVPGDRSMHVCNAPSPAATASMEIGRFIVGQLPDDLCS